MQMSIHSHIGSCGKLLRISWAGLVTSVVGLIGADIDVGPYFGSWFYLLSVILIVIILKKKARWFNLWLFWGVNALLFGIIVRQLWPWILLAVIAFSVGGVYLAKAYRQGENAEGGGDGCC